MLASRRATHREKSPYVYVLGTAGPTWSGWRTPRTRLPAEAVICISNNKISPQVLHGLERFGRAFAPDLRHSFVSLLSDNGAHLTDLASQGVDRNGTTVTGKVYRHQICPVIEHGATAMDQIFGDSAA